MTTGVIGLPVPSGAHGITYFSHANFLDFDLLIWDPESLPKEVPQPFPAFETTDVIDRRQKDFEAFFERGGNLVVILPSPVDFRIREPNGFWPISEFLPRRLRPLSLHGHGFRTRYLGPTDPFKAFWESQQSNFPEYTAYVEGRPGLRPLLLAEGSDERSLGGLVDVGRGKFLFLPRLAPASKASELFEAIRTLLAALSPSEAALPEWTISYSTPRERALRAAVEARMALIAAGQEELATSQAALAQEQRLKRLISDSGASLESVVAEALRELGIDVKPGPESRDDLLLSFDGQQGVAEVKGVTGSAAEKHGAQLEKWCSEPALNDLQRPKGFLVVNAFCNTPLAERTRAVFPANLVEYSSKRDHALVTTSQLLAMVLETRDHPERRKEVAHKLWETVGLVSGFDDLSDRLTQNG